ncbi:glycosyltransferase [Spirulina subsalsa FACHB-351]|uniref:Glycosyltransferase n=1 Tax=Spirulina subsalsa FACHB-351 TaxID=234711 RepID=A0ABT3L716_9CYAN|nr:glycosyltransferase [Spirulina subsalsa]MCW6037301.1 glycosyltransferase [Spirulina subsalsa FACHB-351]
MQPIALVVPWWGQDLKGGAEQQAYQVATRLAQRGHKVEVLTTCCRAFPENWAVNHYPAGVKTEAGLKVHRFPVNPRNAQAFDQVNSFLLKLPLEQLKIGVSPVSPTDSAIFAQENINSEALLKYLKKHQQHYHAFIFLPYLYGIILNGLPLVAERAYLQPCLHNEVYAYLPEIAQIVHKAKGLLFISEGEAQLAQHLYGPGILPKSIVAGAGVEIPIQRDTPIEKIGKFSLKTHPFVLCLGRRDPTKNTDFLIQAYTTFKQKHPDSPLRLVLAGPGNSSYSDLTSGIIDLGLVEENQKTALLSHCQALFQPSRNESYSRVIMEAWFEQRPAAAHRDCLATSLAVSTAQGGWLASTLNEWAELFHKVDQATPQELSQYGQNGHQYAQNNAVWDKVMERYEIALGLIQEEEREKRKKERENPESTSLSSPYPTPLTSHLQMGWNFTPQASSRKSRQLKAIHQLLPNFSYGDAISNQALAIRNYLRSQGYSSEIFTRYVEEKVIKEIQLLPDKKLNPKAGLIYHHSIGSEVTPLALTHPGAKCLIYHNITPAEFFQPFDPKFAQLLAQGRQELPTLAQTFPIAVGDSAYNSSELAACGFREPSVLPIIINPAQWDISPDPHLMASLQDGYKNLLFVGRIAPNKKQDDLVQAFAHYLTLDPDARLILVGWGNKSEPYYCHLLNIIEELELKERVIITGKVNETQLLAFYRTAHLFWSMSEHEGFGVPLIESMWFDIPVLAYKSSAVPETLQGSGLMFTDKKDLVTIAALAKLLIHDLDLRDKVIRAQQQQRYRFLPTSIQTNLDTIIHKLEQAF